MNKNNFLTVLIKFIILSIFSVVVAAAEAQTTPVKTGQTQVVKKTQPAPIKKIKIDYENDTVLGAYDTPDAQFISSRRMIKFKELFNRRTNFIQEVESNKGLFNEYQK